MRLSRLGPHFSWPVSIAQRAGLYWSASVFTILFPEVKTPSLGLQICSPNLTGSRMSSLLACRKEVNHMAAGIGALLPTHKK